MAESGRRTIPNDAADHINHHDGSFEPLRNVHPEIIDRTIYVYQGGQSWEWDELAWTTSSITDGSEFPVLTHDASDETYDDFFLDLIENSPPDVIHPVENESCISTSNSWNGEEIPDPKCNHNNVADATAGNNEPQSWKSNVVIPTSKSNNVSYAQLSFNPEPKVLLMSTEINLPSATATGGRVSIFDNGQLQKDDPQRTARPHHDATDQIVQRINDGVKMMKTSPLLTECSSNSDNGDGNLASTDGPRYSDEPIIFAHGGRHLVWSDETDMNVHLLHGGGCDAAGDFIDGVRKSRNCADTMRKLLIMSRSCAFSWQVGDSKWNAERRAIKQERKLSHHSESLAYSVLQNN